MNWLYKLKRFFGYPKIPNVEFLESLDKKELDEYAENVHHIKLDRRLNKKNMIKEFYRKSGVE